jgi:UDP-N-acetylglucosamine 2-epimerase (non-hydrolysing)
MVKSRSNISTIEMKVAIVLGTRPEIVKMAPLVRACQRRDIDFVLIHTGQHYSYEMDRVFFQDLELPDPKHNLNVGSGTHGKQTGAILIAIEKVFMEERPDVVLVQGDTNTVLAAALAAAKLSIVIGHVEAGLRSFDRRMPEEVNRVLADHMSDMLFAPTEVSRQNLLDEGIDPTKIHVVGNTVVDALVQNMEISERRGKALATLGLKSKGYLLGTLHRQENVDDPVRLRKLIDGLSLSGTELGVEVLLPLHPRTKKNIISFKIALPENIQMIDPVGYLDFLQLEVNALMIMTDSGGIQEEACILRVPCVTLRDTTERPETVAVGGNVLAGADPQLILQGAKDMMFRSRGTEGAPIASSTSS